MLATDLLAFKRDEPEQVKVVVNLDNPVRKQPSLHILSIGVSDYKDSDLDLRFAANDAMAVADTLISHNDRTVYEKVHKRVLLNDAVSLERISKELTHISRIIRPEDTFVLFMAGQGVSLDGSYYYLPNDLEYSSNNAVRRDALSTEKLEGMLKPIKAQKKLLLLDTTNTGSLLSLVGVSRGLALKDKIAISNLMESTGFAVFAASSSKQQAFEGGVVDQKTKKGHSLFTYALLNGLRGGADINNDTKVTIRELEQYVSYQIPRLSTMKWNFKQIPMISVSGNFTISSRPTIMSEKLYSKPISPKLVVMGGRKTKGAYEFFSKDGQFKFNLGYQNSGKQFSKLTYKLNGKILDRNQVRGGALPLSTTSKQVLKPSFSLDDGINHLEISTRDEDGIETSDPVNIRIEVNLSKSPLPSLHILSVGVSDYYDSAFELKYADNDAIDLANTLINNIDTRFFKKIHPPVILTNEAATKSSIENAIKSMVESIKPEDMFVLFMAGHGIQSDDKNYYFAPYDLKYSNNASLKKTGISKTAIKSWLGSIDHTKTKSLFILDTCHSGAVLEDSIDPKKTLQAKMKKRDAGIKKSVIDFANSSGMIHIAASRSNESASEGVINKGSGNGALTHLLINGLLGDANKNADKFVSWREIRNHIEETLPVLSHDVFKYRQIPVFKHEGSDFFITKVN